VRARRSYRILRSIARREWCGTRAVEEQCQRASVSVSALAHSQLVVYVRGSAQGWNMAYVISAHALPVPKDGFWDTTMKY